MTVAELIAALQGFDPALEVCFADASEEYCNVTEVTLSNGPWARCLWLPNGDPMSADENGDYVELI